jgi:hypothetical protein
MKTLLTCWPWAVKFVVKFACYLTEKRANGTLHFSALAMAVHSSSGIFCLTLYYAILCSLHTKIQFITFVCHDICNWYDRLPLWFIMTYVFLIRQIHTTIFGTTMYFQYTIVITIIVLHVSSFYNSSSGTFLWVALQTSWNTHQTLSTQ